MGEERAAEQPRQAEHMTYQSLVEQRELQVLQVPSVDNVAVLKKGKEFVGAHGSVKEGVWRDNDGITHSVAVKSVKVAGNEKGLAIMNKEIEILARLPRHPNVVRVIGVRPGEEPVIVEEWMPMTLKDLTEMGPRPSYGELVRIILDVAKGLLHLHCSL
ncbi:unnamed protein product [Ostreobium quekettii]|uniref:Protein kinase domain-containing protein n=1 Tax=Ostreobium quekettii TaxID=121088 RepID=A0A8S1JD93_9CHLO|nr:unnamed protein product [Ostreobium quekettii]